MQFAMQPGERNEVFGTFFLIVCDYSLGSPSTLPSESLLRALSSLTTSFNQKEAKNKVTSPLQGENIHNASFNIFISLTLKRKLSVGKLLVLNEF